MFNSRGLKGPIENVTNAALENMAADDTGERVGRMLGELRRDTLAVRERVAGIESENPAPEFWLWLQELENRIVAIEADVLDLTTRISNAESTIAGHTSTLSDHESRISALEP